MKIEFSEEDIGELLLDRAADMGMEANKFKLESRYGVVEAKVWFEKPVEPKPVEPAVEIHVMQPL